MKSDRRMQIAGALVVTVLVATVIWVIRSEGERTRQAIREARQESIGPAERAFEKIADQAERVIDRASQLPDQIAPAPNDEQDPGRAKSPRETASDVLGHLWGARGRLEQTPSDDAVAQGAPSTRDAGDLIGDLFGLGHELARTADAAAQDLLALSAEEEMEVGRVLHELIRSDRLLVPSPEEIRRLTRLAEPILQQRDRRGITYHFAVLDLGEVNALAHAGGYVYVSRGLLDWVVTDTELQFVLAHEIAHVDLKHVVKRVTYATRAAEITGSVGTTLAQIAYGMIAAGYTKEEDFEADAWAYEKVLAAGGNRAEMLRVMTRLLAHAEQQGFEDVVPEGHGISGRLITEIKNHLQTHPPPVERLRRLEAMGG